MGGLNSARPTGVDSGLRVSFCMAGNLGVAEKSERLTGCGLSIFKLTTTSREFKNKIGSRNIMIHEFSPTLEALRSTPKNRQISPQTIQTTQALAGRFESLRCSCLLYTSDAADERSSVDLGGRRIIKKKKYREVGSTDITITIKHTKYCT